MVYGPEIIIDVIADVNNKTLKYEMTKHKSENYKHSKLEFQNIEKIKDLMNKNKRITASTYCQKKRTNTAQNVVKNLLHSHLF